MRVESPDPRQAVAHGSSRGSVAGSYYDEVAAAFVRAALGGAGGTTDALLAAGLAAGLRLHPFKRSAALPRVQRALGILRGLAPRTLLDVGSGRGVFLWPLLDAFRELRVIAVDRDRRHLAPMATVRRGGVTRLQPVRMNAEHLALADRSVDVVTILEVLEHLERPECAAAEAMRVARRHVVVSVPAHPDTNPQHLRLYDRRALARLFEGAGARRVGIDYVPNHMLAVVGI